MTVQATSYTVLAGPENFMKPDFKDEEYYDMEHCSSYAVLLARHFREQIRSGSLDRLPLEQCLREYTQQYIARRGDLLLIQDGTKVFTNGQMPSKEPEWVDFIMGSLEGRGRVDISNKTFPYWSDPHHDISYDWVLPFPKIPFSSRYANPERTITALGK